MSKKDILRKGVMALRRDQAQNGSELIELLPDGRILVSQDMAFVLPCDSRKRFSVTIECTDEGIFYEAFLPAADDESGRIPFIVPEEKRNEVASYISQKTFTTHVLPTMYLDPESGQVKSRFFLRLKAESSDVSYSLAAERTACCLLFYHAGRIAELCE